MIKVLSLDVWGTIIGVNPQFSHARLALFYTQLQCASLGLDFEQFSSAFNVMKASTERKSEVTGEHIGYETRVKFLVDMLGIPMPSEQTLKQLQIRQQRLARSKPGLLLWSDLPAFLASVTASGIHLAVISNTGLLDSSDVRWLLDRYGIRRYITYELFSDELGTTKPNPLVFEALTRSANCLPSEILHVGDNLQADYQGALNFGLHAFHGSPDEKNATLIKHRIQNSSTP